MGHAARADDVEGGGRPVAAVLDVSSAKLQPGGGALAPLCFLMGVLSTLAIVSFGAQLFQGARKEAADTAGAYAAACREQPADAAPMYHSAAADRVALLAPLLSNTPISSGEAAPAAPAADVAGPAPPLGEARERLAALRLPWQPALTRQEAERGLSYFGSGKRLRAVAAKLLAGQPIKVRCSCCPRSAAAGPRRAGLLSTLWPTPTLRRRTHWEAVPPAAKAPALPGSPSPPASSSSSTPPSHTGRVRCGGGLQDCLRVVCAGGCTTWRARFIFSKQTLSLPHPPAHPTPPHPARCSAHEFRNLGIDAANSGVFAACTEHLLPGGADLVVAEFCQNEPEDVPFGDPARRGYEQMLRKLLGLPGRWVRAGGQRGWTWRRAFIGDSLSSWRGVPGVAVSWHRPPPARPAPPPLPARRPAAAQLGVVAPRARRRRGAGVGAVL